jgi:hypothetical protein
VNLNGGEGEESNIGGNNLRVYVDGREGEENRDGSMEAGTGQEQHVVVAVSRVDSELMVHLENSVRFSRHSPMFLLVQLLPDSLLNPFVPSLFRQEGEEKIFVWGNHV